MILCCFVYYFLLFGLYWCLHACVAAWFSVWGLLLVLLLVCNWFVTALYLVFPIVVHFSWFCLICCLGFDCWLTLFGCLLIGCLCFDVCWSCDCCPCQVRGLLVVPPALR